MTTLVLICGETPSAPVRWAVGEAGELSGAGLSPSLAALPDPLPPHDELVAVLPGEPVATRALRLPVKGERQLEAAVRLAFEDVLAEPAQDYDFAWTDANGEGVRRVSAVPSAWIDGWMAALAPFDPDVVAADHAALFAEGYEGVVLRERGRLVVRVPGGGLTAQEAFAAPMIPALSGDTSLLSVRIGPSGEAIGSESLVLADERALGAFYLAGLSQDAPASFRRGRYAKRRDRSVGWTSWKLAGGLMAASLALWVAGDLAYGLRYGSAAEDLRAEAAAAFTQSFPGTRVIDLRRQAAARAQTPSGSAFLPLSAALAEAMEQAGSVELSGLTYEPDGRLVADLRYRDFGELERLTEALGRRGVVAQEGSSPRRDGEAYVDQLTLQARS